MSIIDQLRVIAAGIFKRRKTRAIDEDAPTHERAIRGFERVALGGPRSQHDEREPGPFEGHPSVQMDDARFVASTMLRSKWADVEYYGPGAAAMEARRRESLGLSVPEVAPPATAEDPHDEPEPKAKTGKRETIRERLRRLRGELRE